MIPCRLQAVLGLAAAALAAGCTAEVASVALDAQGRSLTVSAARRYPWDAELQVEAVMSALPGCQRRSRLDPVPAGAVAIELYRVPAGIYPEPILILRALDRYYAIGMESCELQRFREVPAQLGQPLGVLHFGSGRGSFVPASAAVIPAGR
ncbi:MAG: hypothetical protein OHK0026_11070 [Rhodocyclaceae bacterium]